MSLGGSGQKKVIGLDFGTLSARGVLIGIEDGKVYSEVSYRYPRGVMDYSLPSGKLLSEGSALAHPDDYIAALFHCLRALVKDTAPGEIAGIGLDATTYSMVPCQSNGEAMASLPAYYDEPMAYIKLWKHHCAQSQASRIQQVQQQTGGIPAIARCGGKASCELALPKLLETCELAPALAEQTYRFCDLGEWLTWQLTGKPVNSMYSQGFKCFWAQDLGGPSSEAMELLRPGFSRVVYDKLLGHPAPYDRPCGKLTPKAALLTGLEPGIPVAAPIGDGSAPGVYFCLNHPGTLAISYGTSIAMAFCTPELFDLTGINGVALGGILPGLWGYDMGQPCAGDMLDWFVKRQLPAEYAGNTASDIHASLSRMASALPPWTNSLTVLDWWNGNRGILNDMSLRGAVLGFSLSTVPEEIYCSMLQGIACGSRRILDHLHSSGICFDRIVVCGGIAEKNLFALQQYANILGRDLLVSSRTQLAARSAAILAAIAAGVPMEQAGEAIASEPLQPIEADREHRQQYENIYQRWKRYHDCISKVEQ